MNKTALILAVLLVLPIWANAAITSMPASVTFHDLPEELTFSVSNDLPTRQALDIELFVPVSHVFIDKPDWVDSGTTERITVKLMPRDDLSGLSYESKIRVSLGGTAEEKTVTLRFLPAETCPLEINASVGEASDSEIELTILIDNKSVSRRYAEFAGVEGLPADWGIAAEGGKVAVNGLGAAERTISLTPGSTFSGTAKVVYSCTGFGDIESEAGISHSSGFGLAGLVGLSDFSLGLPDFGAADFGTDSIAGILVDAILALLAMSLLLAFIVRYVDMKKEKAGQAKVTE